MAFYVYAKFLSVESQEKKRFYDTWISIGTLGFVGEFAKFSSSFNLEVELGKLVQKEW